MYKNILFVIDFNTAPSAIEEVKSLTCFYHAQLFLLHVLSFDYIFSKQPMNEEQDVAKATLIMQRLGSELDVLREHQWVRIGDRRRIILERIHRYQIDLLVSDNENSLVCDAKHHVQFIMPCALLILPTAHTP